MGGIKYHGSLIIAVVVFSLLYGVALAKLEDDKPIGWAGHAGTTGGQGGSVHHCKSVGEAKKYLGGSDKAIVFLSGGGGGISMGSNKTLIGVGGPKLSGLSIRGVSNIIIRNITIRQSKCNSYGACKGGGDGIAISGGAKNIWIDHCDIADGQDECISVTKNCNNLTFTWNKFHYTYEKDHAYFILIASSDGDKGDYNITFAYNWWGDNILERQPRSRYGQIHVVNNLYTSLVSSYCVGVGKATTSRVENNYFKNANLPVMIAASSAGGIVLGNIYDDKDMDPNRKGASFKPFQDFEHSVNMDTTWGNGGFEPPYKMDIYSAKVVEEMVMKWAGTKLEEFDEKFEPPANVATPKSKGKPAFFFEDGKFVSNGSKPSEVIHVLTLQGKSLYKGSLSGLATRNDINMPSGNMYFIKTESASGLYPVVK